MSYTLIIAEKPNAARRIAASLGDGRISYIKNYGISSYKVKRGKQDIIIVPAVGHVFSLSQKSRKGWTYPVFDVEWKPAHEVSKSNRYIENYIKNIAKLSKKADDFIVACDYDLEGSVIGYNVLRFICNVDDAKRMKFSTLTREDLIYAYEHADKTLDWGMIEAGLARHYMDWYYGINLSRALTLSIKSAAGRYKTVSTGRVQGPTMAILVEREKEINSFKPKPYWQIVVDLFYDGVEFSAIHSKEIFWDKNEADKIYKNIVGKTASVKDVKKSKFKHKAPVPFDLTTLQTESYRLFGYTPTTTQEIAQMLYEAGLISYPRTSSQKLPAKIGYRKILKGLSSQESYKELCVELLNIKNLKPTEGKKTDPAHPAIYPTGEKPKILNTGEKRIYDLIVRRFLSVFAKDAVRESIKLDIDIGGEIFNAVGKRTLEPNWYKFYKPYVKVADKQIPECYGGEIVDVKSVNLLDKETEPPKRYTQASIVRKLEKENLGTKATRANIIMTLEKRGYIKGKTIVVTPLGMAVTETLKKFCPRILDIELTRQLEKEMELIQNGKLKKEKVLNDVRDTLTEILYEFKENELEIGKSLSKAIIETRKNAKIMGECPKCGANLRIIVSKATQKRFIGCSNYPTCKNAFPIPQKGDIMPSGKICKACGTPIVIIKIGGNKPWQTCISPDCPLKNKKEANS